MPRPLLRTIGCIAVVFAVASCSSPGKITMGGRADGTVPPTEQGNLAWGSCDDTDIAVADLVRSSADEEGMQCATLEVPVDHDAPGDRMIELALARYPATGDERIGSLVVNPGGPGGSGLEFLAATGLAIPAEWRERFDIVSFDPRGIAASTPIECLTQDQRREIADEEAPDDPAEASEASQQQERDVAEGCAADDDELFNNMGTDEVIDDLDAIREAVGDEQLTYLGLSYGTRIGAGYATVYPDAVRAIVLDGAVTPSRDLVESSGGQIKGIVRALDALVTRCNADETCALAPDAMGRIQAIADALDAEPRIVETDDGDEPLTQEKFVTGVVTALYDPSVSVAITDAIAALDGTDPDAADAGARFILQLAGQQDSKQPDGTYGNGFEAQAIVNCLDADGPLTIDEVPAVRERAGPIPPLLDDDADGVFVSCAALPTGNDLAIGPTAAVDRLLVVGTAGDPATPIEWTTQMADALGGPATITYAGAGHTASLTRSCVTDQVTAFLVDGSIDAPEDCPADPTETDLYAQIVAQLVDAGLVTDRTSACLDEELRSGFTPLELIALNEDEPDLDLIRRFQSAVLSCR